MSERQETVADVVAEMRGLLKPGETLNHTYELLNRLADRIEAAHARKVGNGAKMREALDNTLDALKSLSKSHSTDLPDDVRALLGGMAFSVHAALAEPPRACDVLSANELKLQVFAGLAYQIKIKDFNIRGLEVLLKSVAGAVIDIAYDTNEEGKTND